MTTIEHERKQLLSHSDYQQLCILLNGICKGTEQVQINYYYDDVNFTLCRQSNTLRVRQIESSLKLEKKFFKCFSKGVRITDEISCNIDCLPIAVEYNDMLFNFVGEMTTVRIVYCVDQYTIALDRNYYLGIIDYEIEVESDSIVVPPQFLIGLCNFSAQCESKYSRYVNQWHRQHQQQLL
jgi:uncharacterized protein YjbK